MCDCHERLMSEAKDYIKFKMSQLNAKRYLKSYNDLQQIQNQVNELLRTLQNQKKSIQEQFKLTESLQNQIAENYKIQFNKYESVLPLDDSVIQRAHIQSETVQTNLNTLQEQMELLNTLSLTKTTQNEFEAELKLQLQQKQKLTDEVEGIFRKIQNELDGKQNERQMMETKLRQKIRAWK
ncbi:Conserved_hypothetical protein [Hexamita inflata]|uniref:Uncharacterized protein n=1 Tax=Hexamita inflata TaxID=28002 RepID=A0AA86TEK6_9EUKA|nr:Conserved hypothetical protein [Hexamita inflata]